MVSDLSRSCIAICRPGRSHLNNPNSKTDPKHTHGASETLSSQRPSSHACRVSGPCNSIKYCISFASGASSPPCRPVSAVALVPGKAEAKVGAPTRTAGRKKLKRNSKSSARSRKTAKRREELSEDPAQEQAAGQRMLLHKLASRHAKKIVKKRELVGAGRVRVKEDGQMKAIYTAGRRSTRAVLLRWSRRTT